MIFGSIIAAARAAQGQAKSFALANRGSVAIIFGLAVLPIVFALGAAVDYGRAKMTKSRLQASVDAAALAAVAAQFRGGNPTQIAANYVAQQFANSGQTVTASVTPNASQGTVTVQATASVPTSLMKVARVEAIAITATATAAMGASGGGSTEVAIAFDTTGSMAGAKLTAAQQAANQLVDTLFILPGSSNPNPNVKVGLVPFTDYVNIGLQYRNAPWLTNANDYTTTGPQTCYDTYPNAVYSNPTFVSATCAADGVPYDCSYTSYTVNYGQPVQECSTPTYSYTWNGCVGSQASPNDENEAVSAANPVPALLNYGCSTPLIRLSNDPAVIKNAINGMNASGETYIAPGLLWAWRLLSPNAPFGDGKSYGSAKKILILMTDGANTHSANYPDHEGADVPAANAKLTQLCANVKNAGVQLYAIAFQVSDAAIQNVLSQCATGTPYYFNAQTIADLQTAFASIGAQVTKLRLVN